MPCDSLGVEEGVREVVWVYDWGGLKDWKRYFSVFVSRDGTKIRKEKHKPRKGRKREEKKRRGKKGGGGGELQVPKLPKWSSSLETFRLPRPPSSQTRAQRIEIREIFI